MKGIVFRSTGSWYEVQSEGQLYSCRIRGKLRLDGIKETNPVAVGDHVAFDLEDVGGAITQILPRKNHILRQSVKKTGHSHVLAANVDQVLLIATQKQPRTSLGFIDRFLVSAESFRIPQLLIYNKKDLLNDTEIEDLQSIGQLYESIGVKMLLLSATKDEDLSIVSSLIQGKVTLVAGHSGVGKSTLLNRLSSTIDQSTGPISNFSSKGTHTTTYAEMFQVNPTTFIIDTPGIKEWGLVDMNQQEVSDYFPEMRELRLDCKFTARCLHLNEPKCKIIEGVQTGAIALSRYESYRSIVTGEDNRK
jgi:ribosome biogenesis GTPase